MSAAGAGGVAVVVVNWRSEPHLGRCLSALERQTLPPRRVVLVNNGEPGIAARLPGPTRTTMIVVEAGANLGFAAGNNRGLRETDGCAWVALVNPDAFPEPDWLSSLLAAAEAHPEFSFFASRQLQAESPDRLDGTGDVYAVSGLAWRRDHGRPAPGRRLESEEVFGPCAAAALYRRQALVEAEGFDESFFCYFEDVDLSFRLRLLGHRCLYVPQAIVHHVGSASSGRHSDFSVYHGHRNLVWAFWKNMPAPLLLLHLPLHLLLNALSLALFTWRGQGRALWRAKRDALRELPRVLRERRRVQAARRIGARELRTVMAGSLAGLGAGRS